MADVSTGQRPHLRNCGLHRLNVSTYADPPRVQVDFTGIVGLSNEFQFPIAAFHHAHEAYLVPEVIKQAYGETPGVAIFATFSRYKKESFRASEYAPRILHDAGIRVSMKVRFDLGVLLVGVLMWCYIRVMRRSPSTRGISCELN